MVSILLRTAWALFFKKFLSAKRLSAETKGVNSLSVSWMARFLALIWSWQMEILAFIQCMLARSIMRLKMGCLPGGLNLKRLFHHISKHLDVRQKYSASPTCRIFNSLLGSQF